MARRFYYSLDTIVVNRGDRVILRLISEDVQHGLYIDGYDLNVTAYPGSDGRVSFVADRIIPSDWRFELTKFSYVRAFLKSRGIPFVFILLNASFLTLILYSSFRGGFSAGNYNFGVTMTWVLWWSVLMILMVPFFSRLWCSICPVPLFGEWLRGAADYGQRITLSWP